MCEFIVKKDALLYTSILEVKKITKPVLDDSGYIKFLNHSTIYDKGEYTDLGTVKEWAENYYNKYHNNVYTYKKRINTGVNYWKQNTSEEISAIAQDARYNFDIDARIEFVYRDEPNKCYHMYSFYSDRKNADRAYNFYGLHTSKLIHFIAYFNRAASHLIAEANKPENRIIIPDYSPPELPEKTRNFVNEMKAVGASINLGDRETEALLLYAAGYTAKQIGEMFHRSPKTIENHIEHIKKKTGCQDRKDLHAYVHDIGLAGMERFFFNYFTHE